MSKKSQLKKEIAEIEREIAALEQKRSRSQSAILRCMISGTKPKPEEEEYFRVFSDLIDSERERLKQLYAELDELKK